MSKVHARFRRVAAAFEKEAARVRLCEYSPEADLSDLVDSFMERGGEEAEQVDWRRSEKRDGGDCAESENNERLRSLLFGEDDDGAKHRISAQAQLALRLIGSRGQGFKRQLMSRLREGGLDAGLCKSRWEKNGSVQAGSYEYVDVNVDGTRYIVEAFLAEEFSIARPTASYDSLLREFPEIFVGEVEELMRISSHMCAAAKESMKCMDMPLAPWRRHSYVQAKWVSSYKRTTNVAPAQDSYGSRLGSKRAHCRDRSGGNIKIGGFSVI